MEGPGEWLKNKTRVSGWLWAPPQAADPAITRKPWDVGCFPEASPRTLRVVPGEKPHRRQLTTLRPTRLWPLHSAPLSGKHLHGKPLPATSPVKSAHQSIALSENGLKDKHWRRKERKTQRNEAGREKEEWKTKKGWQLAPRQIPSSPCCVKTRAQGHASHPLRGFQ